MEAEEAKRLVTTLERRVEACEKIVGFRKKSSGGTAGSVGGGATPVSTGDGAVAEVSTKLPLVLQICRLRNGVNKLLEGDLQELADRYDDVRVWLESEASSVSALLSDIEAKRTFILEHEETLKRTAADLRELEELRNYVNARSLEGLDQHRERLEALEANGAMLSEKSLALNNRLRELTMKYNTTMNMVATLFREWSETIASCDLSRGRRSAAPSKAV